MAFRQRKSFVFFNGTDKNSRGMSTDRPVESIFEVLSHTGSEKTTLEAISRVKLQFCRGFWYPALRAHISWRRVSENLSWRGRANKFHSFFISIAFPII